MSSADLVPSMELVLRAQRGDVGAFELVYHACAPGIQLLCRRMVRDERVAADLLQDIFVRAWEKLGSFRGDSSFPTWLHRLAVNLILGHLRHSNRDALRFANDEIEVLPDPGSAALSHDTQMDIDTALAKLPPGARTVFVLHDIQGYSHDEIAQQLGLASGTVRAQLWRARRHLMRLLDT